MFGFGRGSIEIKLNNYNYRLGDIIEGTVALRIRKPVHAKELTIQLIAERRSPSYSSGHQNYQKLYDFKQPLAGEKDYPATQMPVVLPFKLQIPSNVEGADIVGKLGSLIRTVQMLSGSRIYWYLIARLDVKGFDITKRIQINVT